MGTQTKRIILVIISLLLIGGTYFLIRFLQREELGIVLPPPPKETQFTKGPLSPEKEAIRQMLIAPLGGQPGTITDGSDYRIDYLPAGELFQVEIKTTYVERAKNGAIQFFKSKGFSEEDICNLPVAFYLGPEPVKTLEGSGIIVKPKPDFCQ